MGGAWERDCSVRMHILKINHQVVKKQEGLSTMVIQGRGCLWTQDSYHHNNVWSHSYVMYLTLILL